jgi:hypothetical protein
VKASQCHMRNCEGCKVADRLVMDFQEKCIRSKCNPLVANDQDPLSHADDCPKLIHEVRRLERAAKLEHSPDNPLGELSQKLRREGWTLLKDGRHLLRWKMLCRTCIAREEQRESQHRHYLAACKKLRGEDPTYTHMLNKSEF